MSPQPAVIVWICTAKAKQKTELMFPVSWGRRGHHSMSLERDSPGKGLRMAASDTPTMANSLFLAVAKTYKIHRLMCEIPRKELGINNCTRNGSH
jgi:hypothetical protein